MHQIIQMVDGHWPKQVDCNNYYQVRNQDFAKGGGGLVRNPTSFWPHILVKTKTDLCRTLARFGLNADLD